MLQRNMNIHKNVHSFRPTSRDPRRICERSLVCENPPRHFVFAQMTVGLGECYKRIRNENGNKKNDLLENETTSEEVFSPSTGLILAGRYKVIGKVGEGQSSILIKAEDIFHPKKCCVAIKILHASYRNLGPQEASCLLHLKKADTLKVANIAHVLNIFIIGQHFCIVFEYLSPTPIYNHFQIYPFVSKTDKINLIRRIAFQVTQCLAVLSSLNIIHADIKPENILFTNGDNSDVKIIDFGNAIYWVHDEMSLYFGSFELQTVFYRAPEVMFGLPFGPQIDMWSLGCVLAELYLGEPLFFATSKDEILEKMKTMLGPFPTTPFQSGKYFSTFKKFVSRVSTVPGCSKNVVNILKKLGSTDYIFADFLARLLTFDPSLRLSPVEAARHPFLAPECALGFLLPPSFSTQESSYSSMLLTPATYPYQPKIDEKVKKLHYSDLDLLHVGTEATTIGRVDNVVKVLPFNYQEESLSIGNKEESLARNELNTNARESRRTVGDDSSDGLHIVETAVVHGVSNEMSGRNKLPAIQDRTDNAFNESCSVQHTTNNKRSIPFPAKNAAHNESYSGINRDTRSLAVFVKRASKDNAFDESCTVLHTIKEERAIPSLVNKDKKHKYDESYSVHNTNVSHRDVLGEPFSVLNALVDAPRLLLNQDQRDKAFNESCSVKNKFKAPARLSKVKSRKEIGNKKRPRKFVLRRRKYIDCESESSSSILTGDSEDKASYKKLYVASKKSPVKLNDDDVSLSGDIARSTSIAFGSKAKDFSETLTPDTRQDAKVEDQFDDEDMTNFFTVDPRERTLWQTVQEKETLTSETSNKDDAKDKAVVFSRNDTANCDDQAGNISPTKKTARILDVMSRSSTYRKIDRDDVSITSKETYEGSSRKKSDQESNSDVSPTRRNNRLDKRIKEGKFQSNSNERVDLNNGNLFSSRTTYADLSSKTSHKETISDISPAGRTTRLLSSTTGKKDITNSAEAIVIDNSNENQERFYSNNQQVKESLSSQSIRTKKMIRLRKENRVEGHFTETGDERKVNNEYGDQTKVVNEYEDRGKEIKDDTADKISSKNATNPNIRENKRMTATCRAISNSKSRNIRVSKTKATPEGSTTNSTSEELHQSPMSTKSSNFLAFSDEENSFSGEETGRVIPSIKRTKSNPSTKKPRSKNSSSLESILEDWDDSSDHGEKLVSSRKKPRELRAKITMNRRRSMPKTSSNSESLSNGESSAATEESDLDTSSIIQAGFNPKSNNSVNRTISAKSFAEDGLTSSGKESKLVTSSIEQAKKSDETSIEKRTEPRTPRNSQPKESVFDTPSSAVTSTGELLPGGLSDVKKAIRRSEMEQDNLNTLDEIHNIFQAPVTESTRTSSNEKKNSEIFERAEKSHKRSTDTSPGKRNGKSATKNTRYINDLRARESNIPQISTSFPLDILAQDTVKQPRKRKLSYNTVGSPAKGRTMSCLNSLRGRQVAKIQRLSDKGRDDMSIDQMLFLEDDHDQPNRAKDDGRKENAKQCEDVQNSSPPNANGVSQRPAVDATRVESCLSRNSSASNIQNMRVGRDEENRLSKSGSSYSRNDVQVKNGSDTYKKYSGKKKGNRSGIAFLFDDCSQEQDGELTMSDQNESSGDESYEDYEVLLL